ncbi:MAG: 16S rRNA methyltransferase [Gammaproteobacteria bacterium]|nr:MAG: 16S rRNA methyltransferase [Gammaproteobacteria bacterium]
MSPDVIDAPLELASWLARIEPDHVEGFALRMREGTLHLLAGEPELGALAIDFTRGASGFRGPRARSERLVRACGVRDGSRVVDATGGLGTDAWLLASAGAEVELIEQHPVVAALLADGLLRARVQHPDIAARIHLQGADSRAVLAPQMAAVTAVYIDPMYPPRRKSALGDRRLRLLAALCAMSGQPGDDVAGLLAAALTARTKRVVLKRPLREALPNGVPDPSYSLSGRSTRFDVWRRTGP